MYFKDKLFEIRISQLSMQHTNLIISQPTNSKNNKTNLIF